MGVTDDHGQYRTKVKFNTLYNITAIKDAYQPVSVQKQFAQGNATASVTLIMEKNLDWGIITIIVIGALGCSYSVCRYQDVAVTGSDSTV